MRRLLHKALTVLAPLCFNTLNLLLAGNLPPFGGVSVIVEDQGRFLVVRRSDGEVSFPGGFMRWREHPAQTARRECKEETGLDVNPQEALGTYTNIATSLLHLSTINITFAGKLIGAGTLRGSVEGRPEWMAEEDVREKLGWRYPHMLEDYFAYRERTAAEHRS